MEAKLFRLKDGRNLAYAEYGKPDGIPVFYFHGMPGAHLVPEGDIASAARQGLRLIVPVRSGYGQSDLKPDAVLLDWPDDVVELADSLKIPRFGVVGGSGGGPYAMACAYKIPDRLTHVVAVSSPAPPDAFGAKSDMPTVAEREAWMTPFAQRVQQDSDGFFAGFLSNFNEPDRTRVEGLKEFFIALLQESFRQGVCGWIQDSDLVEFQPWGFPVSDINNPVSLWYGEADRLADHGRYLAEQLPNSKATFLPGVGHLLPEADWETIFASFAD